MPGNRPAWQGLPRPWSRPAPRQEAPEGEARGSTESVAASWHSAPPGVADIALRLGDFRQDGGVVDGRRGLVVLAVGDLLHGGAQDLEMGRGSGRGRVWRFG